MHVPISQPGDDQSPCGKWGCGQHGVCDINNTCTCDPGWSGSSCHIAPAGMVNPALGDVTCGNWGVYGVMTLNMPGFEPYCECFFGMKGAHCELECTSNADCGTGTCDTSVGRCQCSTRCYSDADCPLGTCVKTGVSVGACSSGWTGIKCGTALSSSCTTDADCSGGGLCVNGACVCDENRTGLRCENSRATTGMPCNVTSDCATDVCVNGTCAMAGTACEENAECAPLCEAGACRPVGMPPEISDIDLKQRIEDLLEQLATPEGLAQLMAEEAIEEVVGKVQLVALSSLSKAGRVLIKSAAKKIATRHGSAVPQGLVVKAGVKQLTASATKTKLHAMFQAALAKVKNLKNWGGKIFGVLYFAIQVVGMVLDIDDAAGFNAQVPQGGVDMYMRKMLALINNLPELREAGVHFPREYLPRHTFEWDLATLNEVTQDRHLELSMAYLNKLVLNSNGERIQAAWHEAPESARATVRDTQKTTMTHKPALWALAGKNQQVYNALNRWWWLILVLACVVILTIGLGCGLSARSKPRLGVKQA